MTLKLVAIDPADLEAVLPPFGTTRTADYDAAAARVRAALEQAFTVEDVGGISPHTKTDDGPNVGPPYCAECSQRAMAWVQWPCPATVVLDVLRRRMDPPVEHKVTLQGTAVQAAHECGDHKVFGVLVICSCGWESGPLAADPFEPGRLAQAHLDEVRT